jgi:SAM-dependent methyltransferase
MSNQSWERYFILNDRFHLQTHPLFKRVVNIFKAHNVTTVLDLGCGSGRHLIPLAQEGFEVNGIDFSPSAIDLAQKWLQEKNLPGRASIADIHEEIKTFKDGSFDAVIAIDSLSYQTSAEFINSIKEINRLLATGGLFFLTVPSKISKQEQEEPEAFKFNEQALKHVLKDTFKILEWSIDENKYFAVISQEI